MKARKFFMIAIALLMGTQTMVWAQDKPKDKPERKPMNKEQMQTMQCNRIVRELALDDATATQFESVYKNYMNELREARGTALRNKEKKAAPSASAEASQKPEVKPLPTDAEVEQAMKERFARERKVLDVREKYYDEFRKFLSPKQVQKVYSMESSHNRNVKAPGRGAEGRRNARPQK